MHSVHVAQLMYAAQQTVFQLAHSVQCSLPYNWQAAHAQDAHTCTLRACQSQMYDLLVTRLLQHPNRYKDSTRYFIDKGEHAAATPQHCTTAPPAADVATVSSAKLLR
jgi:hypothetical protein